MHRVALLKLTALGDVVRATPLLSALAAAHPGVEVSWIVESVWAPVLEAHPHLHDIIPFDSAAWRRLRHQSFAGWAVQMARLRQSLARRRFDAIINCHPEKWWTALLCPAPKRVALYASGKIPYRSFYTSVVTEEPGSNMVDHYLRATTALGCPPASRQLMLGETTDEAPFFSAFLLRHGLTRNRPIVLFAPFSTGETRCWEPERYAHVADDLCRAHNAQVIITMAPGDNEKARAIAAQASFPLILAEDTTLRQYIALIRRADLLVCVDSSALHLASALGTPYIALFGSTDPITVVPPVGRGTVLYKPIFCAPCTSNTCSNPVFRDCMKQINASDIGQAIAKQFTEGGIGSTILPVIQNAR